MNKSLTNMLRIRNLSLKSRMALTVSLLFVIFAAAIATTVLDYLQKEYKHTIFSQQTTLATTLANSIDDKLRIAQNALLAVSRAIPLEVIDKPDKIQSFLDRRITLNSIFDNGTFVFAKSGQLIAESPYLPNRRGLDFSYRDYFKRTIISGNSIISSPYPSSRSKGHPAVMITVPLVDKNGQIVAILAGSLRLHGKNLLKDLDKIKIGTTGYVAVVDGNRNIVIHPEHSRIMQTATSPGINHLLDQALTGVDVTGETSNDNDLDLLSAFVHLQTADWIVAVNFPLAEAYAPLHKAKRTLILGTAAGTGAILLMAWLLTWRMTSPLTTMTRQVESMKESPALLDIHGDDEIGTLAAAFNGMVTALQEQQKVLSASEQRFRHMADNAPVLIWMSGPEGLCTFFNSQWLAFTGRTMEQETGDGWYEGIHPDDKEGVKDIYRISTEKREPFSLEYRLRRYDGEYRWVMDSGIPLFNLDGSFTGFIGTSIDLTERKTMEQKVSESELKYRIVADNTYDWEYWVDPQGIFIYCSPSCQRITGYSRESFLTDPGLFHRIIHPGDLHIFTNHQELPPDGITIHNIEIRIIRADDVECWLGHICQPIYDNNGVFIGRRSSNRDITPRKKAERALELANSYNRSLLETSLDPFVTISTDGKITDVNLAGELVTGYSRSKLIGTDFSDYFTEPDKARLGYRQMFREGVIRDLELEIRHRDGYTTPVLFNATVYRDTTNNVVGVLAVARDISERKLAEEKIQQLNSELETRVAQRTAQLEASNRELEGFCYAISHDLRAPLARLEGFSTALIEDMTDSIDPQSRYYAERIFSGSRQLKEVIESLLQLSRLTRSDISYQSVNLSSIVRNIVAELAESVPHRQVKFIIAMNIKVKGDTKLLTIAMENLLNNAWKFTSGKADARIEFGMMEETGRRVYFVKDNGAGFDMAYTGKLFQPFQRLHTSMEFPGTGIGLATVQRIIERHGGSIWAEGEEGKGAAFYFTL